MLEKAAVLKTLIFKKKRNKIHEKSKIDITKYKTMGYHDTYYCSFPSFYEQSHLPTIGLK